MNPNPHRPQLKEPDVYRALEAMRTGQNLVDHSLRYFLTISTRLTSPHVLAGDAALQVALFGHLTEVITGHLAQIRQNYMIARPDNAGSTRDLQKDYQQGNMELEAWSLLYHRYVCIDQALSMQQIADETHQDARTLRRRQKLGLTRLTHKLVSMEQAARQTEKQQSLRLVLPQAYAPALVGADSLSQTGQHFLIHAEPPHHLILHGPAGIGKTALALVIVHALIAAGELDDVLWLDMSNLSTSPEVLTLELITQLGLPFSNTDPRNILRSYLCTHRVLLILDRAERLFGSPVETEAVLRLLDLAYIILTSQIKAPSHLWFYQIVVPELKRDDALRLLDQLANHDSAHHATLLKRFDAVWQIAGGNPLALKILLNSPYLPPAVAAEKIRELHSRVWEQLSAYERQVWLLPLLFPDDGLPYDQIQHLVPLDERQIGTAVNTLTQSAPWMVHLCHDIPCYTLPAITTTFLMNQILSGEMVDETTSAFDYFHHAIEHAVSTLVNSPNPVTAIFLLKLADQLKFSYADCRQYAFLLADQIMEAGLWQAWCERLAALLEIEQDPVYQAWLSGMLGTALRWTGQTARAEHCLQHALAMHTYNTPESADILVELAVLGRYQGRWVESHQFLQDAFDIYSHFALPAGVERCIHELSQLSLESHDWTRALASLSKLESWSARAWGIASQAYLALERFDDALQAAKQALDLLPVYHPNQGRILATLGQIYHAKGEAEAAVDHLRLAMDMLDQSKDALGYARVCSNLAAVYLQSPAARVIPEDDIRLLLEQALQIQTQTGDEIGIATTRQNLAWLNFTKGLS